MKPRDTDDLKTRSIGWPFAPATQQGGSASFAIELVGHWPTGHLGQNMIDICATFFLKLRVKSVRSEEFMGDSDKGNLFSKFSCRSCIQAGPEFRIEGSLMP
jgi:hypothetical protein